MTAKHLIEGAMQHTKVRNHNQFAVLTELESATVSRMATGQYSGMRLETFDQIQRTTGVPADTLLAWYRLPEGERLGRIGAPA